jgi:hypothetical protein
MISGVLDHKNQCTHVVLFDPEHLDIFVKHKWHICHGYLRTHGKRGNKKNSTFHRKIMILNGDIPKHLVVDHINRNRLDNRKSNLRLATYRENALNVSEETKKIRKKLAEVACFHSARRPVTEKQREARRATAYKMHERMRQRRALQTKT